MRYCNPSVLALLLKKVSSLEMITGGTYDSAKADSSIATGYGCNQCLRNGWVYAVQDTQSWYSQITDQAVDYTGECCETLATCPNAYDASTTDNVKAGWKVSTVTFASVDMAVHACPIKSWKCASTDFADRGTTSLIFDENYDYPDYGFNNEAISTQDQCSYHITKDKLFTRTVSNPDPNKGLYAEIRFPIWGPRSSNTGTSAENLIHYMEWDSNQVTSDSVYTAWPSSQSSVAVVDD